jgi:uncharacterized membrane protein YdjX (TVP38/TMEM64 family)
VSQIWQRHIMQFLLNGLIIGSIYALVAFSYTLTGFFHFAHGAVEAEMRKKRGQLRREQFEDKMKTEW